MSELQEQIITAIKKVKDPELPINIYDLGLIRKIEIEDDKVHIDMTLTTPNCPVADLMPSQVFDEVSKVAKCKVIFYNYTEICKFKNLFENCMRLCLFFNSN